MILIKRQRTGDKLGDIEVLAKDFMALTDREDEMERIRTCRAVGRELMAILTNKRGSEEFLEV